MHIHTMEPAIIRLKLPPFPPITLHMLAYGDPITVKKALRKACSRRRSIIALRPATFAINFIKALASYGLDLVGGYPIDSDRGEVSFSYEIDLERATPYIMIIPATGEPERMPVYEFLGSERTHVMPQVRKARSLSGVKLGRPSNLSRKLAAARLEKELKAAEAKQVRETSDPFKVEGQINDNVLRLGPGHFGIIFPEPGEFSDDELIDDRIGRGSN